MLVDGTIGGTAEGGDIGAIVEQVAKADRMGYAGVWSTEVARNPFLPAAAGSGAYTAPDYRNGHRGSVRTQPDEHGDGRKRLAVAEFG